MRHDKIHPIHSLFFPVVELARDASWRPSADVYRNSTGWLVKLDLAGVRPEDVQVRVQDNRLIVHGTRRDYCLQEGCSHYQMEITYNHFERSLTLPCDLAQARIRAEHRHGMLLIEIQVEDEK